MGKFNSNDIHNALFFLYLERKGRFYEPNRVRYVEILFEPVTATV